MIPECSELCLFQFLNRRFVDCQQNSVYCILNPEIAICSIGTFTGQRVLIGVVATLNCSGIFRLEAAVWRRFPIAGSRRNIEGTGF